MTDQDIAPRMDKQGRGWCAAVECKRWNDPVDEECRNTSFGTICPVWARRTAQERDRAVEWVERALELIDEEFPSVPKDSCECDLCVRVRGLLADAPPTTNDADASVRDAGEE